MTKLIKGWKELSEIPNESETHILEVGEYNGWLKAKDEKPYIKDVEYIEQVENLDVYLSTHTFYGNDYELYTEVLQRCGFDVQLANWDE